MKPFDLAWQLLKANPSWMRRDANKGRIHTNDLPNPFDPNYQEQLIEEEQRRNAEDEAMERRNELFRQNYFTALENRVYDRLNNQTVGIDNIPTTQKYGQASGDVRRNYRIPLSITDRQFEAMPTTLDTNYQRFYSDYS